MGAYQYIKDKRHCDLQNKSQHASIEPCTSSRAESRLASADAEGDLDASILARQVAAAHDVTPAELFHHSRSRAPIATTRQIAMYLMHVLLGRSLTAVGDFYRRDRTTVAHACARIEDMRDDTAFDEELCELEDHIFEQLGTVKQACEQDIEAPAEAANDD